MAKNSHVSRKDNKGRKLRDGESYRKSDGLYMYRWSDLFGKRNTIYAPTLEELREKEEKIRRDLSDGIRVGEKNVTVNDVYEMWKKDKLNLKENTKRNYVYMYEHFVQDKFGTLRIQAVRRSDVRRFYNGLIGEGHNKMAINTLERVHTVLHQVFTLAVEDNYILKNPCDDMMGECKRNHNYETPRRHALTVAQQSAFLDYINESNRYRHWSPLFTFFLGTGCRIGEVIGLRWEDVHMDEKEEYIDINHNLVYFKGEDGKCQYHISTPKTVAGRRIIPMLPQVKNALLEERQFQREAELECKSIIDGYTDFIFLNKEGHPHNQQTVNRTIRRILLAYNNEECENAEKQNREAVLLPNFSCHNLRHTFATRLCENETNLKVIQEVLGHKDIATTMNVYAEATKDRVNQSFVGLSSKIYLG